MDLCCAKNVPETTAPSLHFGSSLSSQPHSGMTCEVLEDMKSFNTRPEAVRLIRTTTAFLPQVRQRGPHEQDGETVVPQHPGKGASGTDTAQRKQVLRRPSVQAPETGVVTLGVFRRRGFSRRGHV